MEIIPAIDLIDGKCVRLSQGKFDQVTVFSDDPVEMAAKWASEGEKRLHIVDLIGSKIGEPQELTTVSRIVNSIDIPIQLGGGIRSIETAKAALDIGINRIIIGTSAALDINLALDFFNKFGDAIIVGIDAKDGYVAVKGWEELTSKTAIEFARSMQNIGAKRIIYTDISRDGMMSGANVSAMKKMAEMVEIPVIASGGITTLDDIRQLSKLESFGLEGAILGKALYTGALTLHDVIKAAEQK